jgi:glycosyltransferase involved in cell wall biosynthesis
MGKRKYKTTLIIPTKNEEGCIGRVLDEVPKEYVDEILIVDKSTDGTVKEVKAHLRPKKDKVVLQKNKGYGNAFIQGIKIAKGDVIIMMDADGSHNPSDIPFLLHKIDEGYGYAMSSRYAVGAKSFDDTFIRWTGNQIFTKLTNMIHNMHITDSLYLLTAVWKKDLLRMNLKSPGFEMCTEILVKAGRLGLRIAEIPAIERKRYHGESKVSALIDGFDVLKTIFRKYD